MNGAPNETQTYSFRLEFSFHKAKSLEVFFSCFLRGGAVILWYWSEFLYILYYVLRLHQ